MPTFLPSLALSTDNAAMIAAAGLRQVPRRRDRRRSISTPTRRWRSARAAPLYNRAACWSTPTTSGSTPKKRQEFVRITDEVAAIVEGERRQGRHRARVGDAHHLRRLRERLGRRADPRLPGLAREARAGRTRLPAPPDRRGQRRRAPEAHDHGAPGRAADHRRQARSRPVGAGLLRRVRRPAARSASSSR